MRWAALALISLSLVACNRPVADPVKPIAAATASVAIQSSPEAEKFLKWSMNKYAGLKSYTADVSWSISGDSGDHLSEKRQIAIAAPNRFKVLSVMSDGNEAGAISDGVTLLEFSKGTEGLARKGAAPATLASIDSRQMTQPVLNGSLLYQFFGGSDNFDGLVDRSKGGVGFGADTKTLAGKDAKTVAFYAPGGYGNVSVVIEKESGLVSSIEFDEDGLRQEALKEAKPGARVPVISGKESFDHIVANSALPANTFDPALPKGVRMVDPLTEGSTPPVPLGQAAPDFKLARMDGSEVTLASLKGKVVMIDFWATWCGPCRASLPVTDKIAAKYASQGLEVLATSAEDKDTISDFIKANGYKFHVCVDKDAKVSATYHVDGIPCAAFIDRNGHLTNFLVGLHPESDVIAALHKAGLRT